jgi:hypothetical protein
VLTFGMVIASLIAYQIKSKDLTMQKALQPKLILVAILAAYAMPHMALAENRAEAIELGKIEFLLMCKWLKAMHCKSNKA